MPSPVMRSTFWPYISMGYGSGRSVKGRFSWAKAVAQMMGSAAAASIAWSHPPQCRGPGSCHAGPRRSGDALA
ncbi:hypothetical protein NL676_024331 [Syzygium grande]|nr:hypothetical protein NL676_024331 [Syzygium grande]